MLLHTLTPSILHSTRTPTAHTRTQSRSPPPHKLAHSPHVSHGTLTLHTTHATASNPHKHESTTRHHNSRTHTQIIPHTHSINYTTAGKKHCTQARSNSTTSTAQFIRTHSTTQFAHKIHRHPKHNSPHNTQHTIRTHNTLFTHNTQFKHTIFATICYSHARTHSKQLKHTYTHAHSHN